jgi:hypothetical protein
LFQLQFENGHRLPIKSCRGHPNKAKWERRGDNRFGFCVGLKAAEGPRESHRVPSTTVSGDHESVGELRQKATQLGRGFKLRHRVELLEGARKGVRQAPHCPGRELCIFRLEIEPMDLGQQASGRLQLAVDESCVEDQLRRVIGDLSPPPGLHLALQRLEVPLNPVHANRERINQVKTLGVLGQDRRESTSALHVVAREGNTTASCPSCP